MQYICVTHVDSKTGVRCNRAPMKNGPAFPAVKGFTHEWHDQSNWPLTHPDQYPRFYGTCDDDADTTIEGVVMVFNDLTREHKQEDGTTTTITTTAQEQYETARAQEMYARLPKTATPVRLRLALLDMGLLDSVQAYFDSLDDTVKNKIAIIWEYSTEIHKGHPMIQNMAQGMEMSEEALDEIFVKANEISENPFAKPKKKIMENNHGSN